MIGSNANCSGHRGPAASLFHSWFNKNQTRLHLLLIYQVAHSVLGRVLSTWLPFADGRTKGFGSSVVTGITLSSSLHFPITPHGSPGHITGKTHKVGLSPGVWHGLQGSFHLSHTNSVTLSRLFAPWSFHLLVGKTGTTRTLGS